MSALAVRTGSVNLGQGFPDSDGPPSVIARAVAALEGGANQYAPGPGIPALRQAIARHQQRHYGIELDPDTQVVVTTGCTEAIAAALLGLVDPGDEVVVLEPYYDSYVAMLQMAGGVRRPVTLRPPDFRLDTDALRAAVTPRTRFMLVNSPHNPTGTVLTRDELAVIAEVAVDHDLVVITDEVYEHLTFDDHEHIPLATLPGMAERTLTLSSVGKSYSFTGWKVGWATGPEHLVASVLAAKQWLTFTSGAPLQPAVALALDEEPDFPRSLAADLQERRDLLCSGLAAGGPRGPGLRGHLLHDDRHRAPRLAGRPRVLPGAARAGRRRGHPDPAVLRRRHGSPARAVGVLQGPSRSSRRASADSRPPTSAADPAPSELLVGLVGLRPPWGTGGRTSRWRHPRTAG